jgi:competence protein ComEC
VRAVLRGIPVRELWISAQAAEHPTSRALLASAAERAVPVRLVGAGDAARLGQLDLELLWPPRTVRLPSSNDSSLVLRVRGAGGCALLPGDAPRSVERALLPRLERCAVLKLAHHGSRTSSAPEWIARVDPELAIASAGRRARGTLPHPEVRAELAARRVALYETLRDGAIEVQFTRSGLLAIPFRARSPE